MKIAMIQKLGTVLLSLYKTSLLERESEEKNDEREREREREIYVETEETGKAFLDFRLFNKTCHYYYFWIRFFHEKKIIKFLIF